MKKTIDCFLIGHNEMDFRQYESAIRQMGTGSGAYRDLNLNFIQYRGRQFLAPEIFNLFSANGRYNGQSIKPLNMLATFSATIAYLGSYLNRRGFSFDYVNSFQEEKEELAEKLRQENILTIAVTTTLYISVFPILEIIDFIRENNRTAKIIVGGPFVSAQVRNQYPVEVEFLFNNIIGADFYVISSQGEAALVKIIEAIKNDSPLDHIDNIYYKYADGYISNPLSIENNSLSDNLVDWNLFAGSIDESVHVRTAISCPFSCAFCGSPKYAGRYQTLKSGEVERELNVLQNLESVRYIQFIEDTFNVPVARFKEILRMMVKNKYKFKWHAYFRCQFADREMVELMKESGCVGVYLGLESGNDRILENMNKAVNVEKYMNGISLLKEYGIVTHGSFIVGFPGETHQTVKDTMCFIEESGLDFYRAQLWYCLPISPIWAEREKYGLKGKSFEWRHETMDSQTACDFVDQIFLSVKQSVSVPPYGFDFHNVLHLLHRLKRLEQVKAFLRSFNNGVKEKLVEPATQGIGLEVVNQLKSACRLDS